MQNKRYFVLFSLSFYLIILPAYGQVDSIKVYYIGNSVTENLKPEGFEGIVKAADKKITRILN